LILPSLLPLLSAAIVDLGAIGFMLHWNTLALALNPIPMGLLSFFPSDLASLVYLMAIGIVMFLRFTRVSRQQAHSAAELEAARRVQSLLLRPSHAYADRFSMEAVYRPAAEVGGDFFHTTEIDGCTRIVVGDVSGKGLGAAMLVATLIGALDSNLVADPATVLMQLNELLLARQQGGFATCLCASIDRDCLAAFSNAGHLAPYLNGGEVPVESGLPLGIAPDPAYTGFRFQLVPGDSLTFLSDGVVEARNETGELFGFDRAAAISNRPAHAIAQIAQAFGQEDDITVLTLRYSRAEVLRA
jgi:serine phosphatase RsbU (regulator of sigma subunit)